MTSIEAQIIVNPILITGLEALGRSEGMVDMAEETYHGHKLTYSTEAVDAEEAAAEEQQAPSLAVDGQDVDVVIHSDGTYSAKEYYYDKFGSIPALGRAIARRLPDTE